MLGRYLLVTEPPIEDQILEWRGQEIGKETYEYTVLLCEAEEELRKLRKRLADLRAFRFPNRTTAFEDDRDALSKAGVRYVDSFMEIDQGPAGGESERLYKWMAELINEVYQIGFASKGRGQNGEP
jgi:hypothetical protein